MSTVTSYICTNAYLLKTHITDWFIANNRHDSKNAVSDPRFPLLYPQIITKYSCFILSATNTLNIALG